MDLQPGDLVRVTVGAKRGEIGRLTDLRPYPLACTVVFGTLALGYLASELEAVGVEATNVRSRAQKVPL